MQGKLEGSRRMTPGGIGRQGMQWQEQQIRGNRKAGGVGMEEE